MAVQEALLEAAKREKRRRLIERAKAIHAQQSASPQPTGDARLAIPKTPVSQPVDEASGLGGLLRQVAQGTTLGFADEIEAGLRAPFSDKNYTELQQDISEQNRAYAEENPGTAFLAQLGGSALLPVPGAGTAGMLGKGLLQLVSKTPKVLSVPAKGAALGTVAGAGYSDPGERTEGALSGAALGAGASTAVAGLSKGLGMLPGQGIAKGALEKVGLRSPKKAAATRVQDILEEEGIPTGKQALKEYLDAALPKDHQRLADASKNLKKLSIELSKTDKTGKGAQAINELVDEIDDAALSVQGKIKPTGQTPTGPLSNTQVDEAVDMGRGVFKDVNKYRAARDIVKNNPDGSEAQLIDESLRETIEGMLNSPSGIKKLLKYKDRVVNILGRGDNKQEIENVIDELAKTQNFVKSATSRVSKDASRSPGEHLKEAVSSGGFQSPQLSIYMGTSPASYLGLEGVKALGRGISKPRQKTIDEMRRLINTPEGISTLQSRLDPASGLQTGHRLRRGLLQQLIAGDVQ